MSLEVWQYVAPRLAGLLPDAVSYSLGGEKTHRSVIRTINDNGINESVTFDNNTTSYFSFRHDAEFHGMRINPVLGGRKGLQLELHTLQGADVERSVQAHLRVVSRHFGLPVLEKVEAAAVRAWLEETQRRQQETQKRLLSVRATLQEVSHGQVG